MFTLVQSTLLCLSAFLIGAIALYIKFRKATAKEVELNKTNLLFMAQIVVLLLIVLATKKWIEATFGILPSDDVWRIYDTGALLFAACAIAVPVTEFTMRLRPPEEERRWWHDLLGMSPVLLAIAGLVAYTLWIEVVYLK